MKLFGRRIFERFKAFFHKTSGGTQHTPKFNVGEYEWTARCKHYNNIFNMHALAKSQTLTIAGQILANDIYLEPAQRDGEAYPRAEDAVGKCEELNDDVGMNLLIFDSIVPIIKYGSCFWEKTGSPSFNCRIMPQMEVLAPNTQDEVGNITSWQLRPNMLQRGPVFRVPDDVVHFPFNVTSTSWPYGTSLYTGLDVEFEILEQLEVDLQAYMHKQAFPKEMVALSGDATAYVPSDDETSTVRSHFNNWGPGETMVTNFPLVYTAGGTGDTGVRNLEGVLNFVKDQITDGLMMPPISKQYSSTYASSKEMTDWAQANLISPLRRLMAWVIQRDVYTPYLMDLGYSVRVVPKLNWEPPDMNREEDAAYYTQLVGAQIMPPVVAARELGIEKEYLEWRKEEDEREEEQAMMQALNPQPQQQGGKSYTVTEHSN